MTLKNQIMKLQTYKIFEGEDTVYVDRDDVLKLLEQQPILDTRQRERQLEMEYQHGYDKGWEEGRKALEQQPCEDWYDVPSDEMTLEQARQAVKDLRKKLAEYLKQQPCEDCISRQAVLDKKELVELEDGQSFYCINPEDVETLLPVTPQSLEQIKWERDTAINQLQQLGYGLGEKVEPCEDCISREAAINVIYDYTYKKDMRRAIEQLPSVKPQPKTGHWSRKTKVDAYDIGGVKTWGIKCQCDRCCFTTIVVEDFGYYKYCPNCGVEMEGDNGE